jgi:hypothetical protein
MGLQQQEVLQVARLCACEICRGDCCEGSCFKAAYAAIADDYTCTVASGQPFCLLSKGIEQCALHRGARLRVNTL